MKVGPKSSTTADKAVAPPVPMSRLIKQSPIFYGWIIMAVGTLGMISTGPGQTYTVSIFIEFIIDNLGISRSLVSTLYSLGTLVGSFTLPFWGRQIDKRGARKMVVIISVLFGLACIYMGFIQNAVMLGLGFILVRMLGQGSLGLVSQTVINQWWVRRRGMVNGISGLFMALLGMGAFPSLVYALISTFEWRLAYAILGLGLLFIMAPLGYLLFRNRPEDYHQQPDGIKVEADDANQMIIPLSFQEENWTLGEAMRTRAFWTLVIGLSSFSMLSTGLFFHLVSIFENRNLDPSIAATVFVPVALAAALTNLAGGVLTDRIPLRFLLAIGLLLQAGSLFTADVLQGAGTALLFGIVLGSTNGIARAVGTVVWPAYYGRENLGSILGFTSAMGVVGAALGPLPFGYVYDMIGTYRPVLLVSAGICVLLSLIALTIRSPKKKQREQPA